MSQMSDFLETRLLDVLFRTQAAYKPTAIYIAACTAAPTDASTGSTIVEPSGNNYGRVQVTQLDANWTPGAAGTGTIDNAAIITWLAATGSWGTITHIAICDAVTAGNLLMHGAIAASKTVGTGDTLKIAIGDLDITLA